MQFLEFMELFLPNLSADEPMVEEQEERQPEQHDNAAQEVKL